MITLEGSNYVSRVGMSCLKHLGLDKYIALNEEEYISKTIDLARNKSELKLLHQTIRLKFLQSELYNSINFTKSIETAFKDMCNNFIKL